MEQNIRKRGRVEPTQSKAPKKSQTGGAHGPLRGSTYISPSMRIDYQPDICTDFKRAGFCGRGESCKYSHDRGDYKSGAQLEKEWSEARKRRLALDECHDLEQTEEEEEVGDGHACSICRKPFVDHVMTKCNHHFCERCAKNYHEKKRSASCATSRLVVYSIGLL
ncbi:hypothetical protein M0R45_034180 [Rubus argutus]|uniref:RING-type E3 ubiquitin transferase n=1 Tax=Rubus argutus TaxID=59490 RepID=A0AAW1VPF1_RUBAR